MIRGAPAFPAPFRLGAGLACTGLQLIVDVIAQLPGERGDQPLPFDVQPRVLIDRVEREAFDLFQLGEYPLESHAAQGCDSWSGEHLSTPIRITLSGLQQLTHRNM